MRTLAALFLAMLLGSSANPQKPKPWKAVAAALVFACLAFGCAAPTEDVSAGHQTDGLGVLASGESGLVVVAVVECRGDVACEHQVQLGVVVNGLETVGAYWGGTIGPGARREVRQDFLVGSEVIRPGDVCSEYFVILTDPTGSRVFTYDCAAT